MNKLRPFMGGIFLILLSVSIISAAESVFTTLRQKECAVQIDKEDPNETSMHVCPGVGGYSLIIRQGEGRKSIDIVTPDNKHIPLEFWESVTPHFSHLGPRAEWRVVKKEGVVMPMSLMVRVESHENDEFPERVTHSYAAIAKLTPEKTCLTDVILIGSTSKKNIRRHMDAAVEKACFVKR